ncbi:hypothetical protein QBC32DRAFT_221630 [Pseudoneurospora amorphoporcata]|uniref:tRNA wybutosine-synthesizing protein 4 n=1 Tax=Pseudoneurospora amorphoporcata TaxID=241081 RepID=A0AAN6SD55_9PEZI|nr:hypothetical protein QBC32DRAFT_221630 [Pseudoneurospora amorphoporcata]
MASPTSVPRPDQISPSTPLLQSDSASTIGPASSRASSIRSLSPSRRRHHNGRTSRAAAASARNLSFASALLSSLCAGSITIFSMYGHIFQERLHYTQFEVNGLSSAASIATYMPVPLLGYMCDRVGPAPLSFVSALFFAAGYGLAAGVYQREAEAPALADGEDTSALAYWAMIAAFVFIGVGTCSMYMSAVATCAKNFGRGKHRGLALAVPIAAFGLSGMWQSQLGSRVFYERFSDGTKGDLDVFHFFVFLGILLFAVGCLGTFGLKIVDEEDLIDEAVEELERSGYLDGSTFLQGSRTADRPGYGAIEQSPLDMESAGILDPHKADDTDSGEDENARIKKTWVLNAETRRFLTDHTMWCFALGFFLMIGPGEAFINNLGTVIKTLYPPHLKFVGEPTSAATHVSIVGITSTLARLLTGSLTDLLAPSPQARHVQITSSGTLERKRFSLSRMSFLLFFAVTLSVGLAALASGWIQNHGERFWVASGLVGAGYGAVFSLTPIIITVIWGVENFATNWGIVAMFPALGATFWGLVYSAVYQSGVEKAALKQGGEEDQFCYGNGGTESCNRALQRARQLTNWTSTFPVLFCLSHSTISRTNNSSIVSKRSVEKLYYPNEPHFFRFFVKKFQRRAPLINRGYHFRLHVIDVLVRNFLQDKRPGEEAEGKKKVVVNLGCGSDVLPWQCLMRYPDACRSGEKNGAKFVDVDFPDLIERKKRTVLETPELLGMLTGVEVPVFAPPVPVPAMGAPTGAATPATAGADAGAATTTTTESKTAEATSATPSPAQPTTKPKKTPNKPKDKSKATRAPAPTTAPTGIVLTSDQYVQIGCDLRDLTTLEASLKRAVGGDLSACTFLFVAEVSITYMETPGADAVIQWASTLGDSEFVLLEQLLPSGPTHPFASTMLSHFHKLNTPIKSVDVYPTVASQVERFRSRGWGGNGGDARDGDVRVWTLWEAWADAEDTFVNAADRKRLEEVEPFDEWEEFALFASHYCVVRARTVARKGEGEEQTKKKERGIPNGRELGVPVEKVKVRWDDVPGQRGQRRFAAGAVLSSPSSSPEKKEEVKLLNVMGLGTKSRLQNCDVYGRKNVNVDGTEEEKTAVPFTFREGGPSTRMCHALTDLGNSQLLVGGRASPSTPLKDCWLLEKGNGNEGEWAWKRTHDLPIPLYRHCVARLGKTDMAMLAGGRGVADIFSDWLLYEPKLGWIRCEIAGDVKPISVYGATLACLRQERDSFSGVFAGGLSDDGLIADQLLAWNLDVTDSSKPVVRFGLLQVKYGAGGLEEAISRQLLTRFGASCLPRGQTDFLILGGVIKDHLLDLEDEILLCSLNGTELTITQRLVPEAANDETASHPGPLLLVGTCPVVTPDDRRLVIMGGGATCFSMGTFWNKGISSLELPLRAAKENGSAPTTARGWAHEKTVDIVPGEPRSLPLRSQVSDSVDGDVNGSVSVRTQPVPRVKLETAEDFARIVREGRPVVLEGLNLGDCVSKWGDGNYVAEKIGTDRKVVIHDSTTPAMDFTTKNFRYVTTEFGDFMKRVEKGDRLYLRALSLDNPTEKPAVLSDDFPLLATDFVLPPELALVDERLFSSVLRVSGPVNMWLHYDVMANVYCQIGGSKRMILFPPSDVEHLSFAPGASSSSIDVFSALFGESSDSRYLAQVTHAHEAVVAPGDVLFLPPLWLHTATPTSDSSVAVNVFFRDLDGGCYAAGKDVYGNRDLAAYEKGRLDLTRIANSFQKLSAEAREFYLLRLADELRRKAKGAH